HAARMPAVEEAGGIEERTDVGSARRVIEATERGDAPDLLAPRIERLAAKIGADLVAGRPWRQRALALGQRPRVIEIVEPVERREAPDREVAIGPEQRQLVCQRGGTRARIRAHGFDL